MLLLPSSPPHPYSAMLKYAVTLETHGGFNARLCILAPINSQPRFQSEKHIDMSGVYWLSAGSLSNVSVSPSPFTLTTKQMGRFLVRLTAG